jgi:RND superfamily putative drug exporter
VEETPTPWPKRSPLWRAFRARLPPGLAPRRDGDRRGHPDRRRRLARGPRDAGAHPSLRGQPPGRSRDRRRGAQGADWVDAVYGNFPLVLALILGLTFILLARAFRSLVLPLQAVLLNLLSVGAVMGALVLVWQNGLGSEAIWDVEATRSISVELPIVVIAFQFGVSMDYQVFIVSRIREAYDRGGSTQTAVIEGIGSTGRLVTSSALILGLAFLALSVTPGTENKMFATALAAGILLDATIIRGMLLPATIAILGRWNWWLPDRPARMLRVERSFPRNPETTEESR